MSEKSNVARYVAQPPAETPVPSIPSLPSDSGAIFVLSPTKKLRKDAAFVDAHTQFLQARIAQCDAMRELVESRIKAATTLAKLSSLPEITLHEYKRGRAERLAEQLAWEHCGRVASIQYETREVGEQTKLAAAQKRLAEIQATIPPKQEASPQAALSPDEVVDTISQLPEIPPETVQTISRLLFGLLQEKK